MNAANARWGSLYDTLYGTDVIKGKRYSEYNAERAKKVIEYVRNFLDESFPLSISSWKEITKIKIEDKRLLLLKDSEKNYLKNENQFIGYNGEKDKPSSILIKNNNLHIDILIDDKNEVGKNDRASIADVIAESAYLRLLITRTLLLLLINKMLQKLAGMKGDLTANIENGKKFVRIKS